MNVKATCFILIVFLSIAVGNLDGQNIIPDPGFEDWDGTSGGGGNTLTGMTHWYNTSGTSDHHHVDLNPGSNLTGLNPCPTGDGRTDCGFPVAGGGVLGCWKGNGPDGSKEWAGTKLTEPTVPGDCYEISFWVQNKKDRPGNEFVTNQWGVFFSQTPQPIFNANLFNFDIVANQWVATDQVIDGSDWQLIELNFQADAAYEYLFLGFMGNVSTATQRIANPSNQLGCYVWFDELYVRHVDVEVPPTQRICVGDSTTISFTSDYPIRWAGGGQADTTRSLRAAPLATTTYYVTATGATGCTKVDSVTVEVEFPNNVAVAGERCIYSEDFTLAPDARPGRWVGPGIQDEDSSLFSPALAGAGEHTVYYLAAAGCAESATYTVNIAEVIPPEIGGDNLSGCTPLTVNFGESIPGSPALAYRWEIGDTSFTTDQPKAEYTFRQGGDFVVSVGVVYSEACIVAVTSPSSVTVNQSPEADFELTPERVTNLAGETTFRDRSTGNINSWEWRVEEVAAGNRPEVPYIFSEAGDYQVLLNVTDQAGCQDSTQRTITVLSEVAVYLPTAFSPNGDGINDQYEPGIAGQFASFQLEIYNRWGGLLFATTDPDNAWDGTGINGEPVEVGTYLYTLSYQLAAPEPGMMQEAKRISGNLNLLR